MTGFPDLTYLRQEVEVLHIAGADLKDVHVFRNEPYMLGADYLGHH